MSKARVYKYGIHLGEEKVVEGNDNSGMVYFSGCHLACNFCYTPEISFEMRGRMYDEDGFEEILEELVKRGARNINLVSPSHVWSAIYRPLGRVKKKYGKLLPIVLKVSGFERLGVMREMMEVADVIIPDFKVWGADRAHAVNLPPSYGEVALRAIITASRELTDVVQPSGVLSQGILVRHLLMPDHFDDSMMVIERLGDHGFRGHINFMTYFIKPGSHSVARANPREVALLTSQAAALGMTPMVNGKRIPRAQETHYAQS
jgi:putative pyruvate formate lyase activating enzyme